jgi:hypothetical protein
VGGRVGGWLAGSAGRWGVGWFMSALVVSMIRGSAGP